MALWDALTGKILHWNNVKEEANQRVCGVMKTFVSSRLTAYPGSEQVFTQARNVLVAQYLGTIEEISSDLDNAFAKYKKPLFSLNVNGYLRLICALHMGHEVGMFIGEQDASKQEKDIWFAIIVKGIVDMYRCPTSYSDRWFHRIPYIAEPGTPNASRLAMSIYDEIAPILGLPQNDVYEGTFWFGVMRNCTVRARHLLDMPTIDQLVQGVITAY